MTEYYKAWRIIDGKPAQWVIVDENGNIINKNSSKDELKKLGKFTEKRRKVKTCCICESHNTYIDSRDYENWFTHKCQNDICTVYLCSSCYNKYDPNSEII